MTDITPVLYVFNFKKEYLDKALKRLTCSVTSLNNQVDKIYIINASENYVMDKLLFNNSPNIEIINKPIAGFFNKSKIANWSVKHLLSEYKYFIMSDIDIVYPPNYIKRLIELKNIYSHLTIRLMPKNLLTPHEIYSSNYNKLLELTKQCRQHPTGEARGLGLIHIKSYIDILGMNEYYLGNAPEDWSLNNRLEKYGNKIIFEPKIVEIHLWHQVINREEAPSNKIRYLNEIKQIEKGQVIFNNPKTWGEY
jgi:hypothetical protein